MGAIMIRIGLLVAVVSIGAAQASAADMPVKAPPRVAAPYSWSGLYAGGNVGYRWGRVDSDASLPIGSQSGDSFTLGEADVAIFTGTGFSQSSRFDGVSGGAQIGFNVQSGAVVFGFEADIQGGNQSADVSRSDPFTGQIDIVFTIPGAGTYSGAINGTTTTAYRSSIGWFGTVRGRLGVAADNVLFYGTGGLAYGRARMAGSIVTDGISEGPNTGTGTTTILFGSDVDLNAAKTLYGWTIGGGIEWAINAGWSVKAEYLYMDLGSITVRGVTQDLNNDAYDLRAKVTNQIARIGVNYRFGNLP
jgi:outer membrane immunogenic protein